VEKGLKFQCLGPKRQVTSERSGTSVHLFFIYKRWGGVPRRGRRKLHITISVHLITLLMWGWIGASHWGQEARSHEEGSLFFCMYLICSVLGGRIKTTCHRKNGPKRADFPVRLKRVFSMFHFGGAFPWHVWLYLQLQLFQIRTAFFWFKVSHFCTRW